jgi:two-component system OmpR family response regulator
VRRAGRDIDLSPTEFKLLRYLMLNPNRVLSKAQILDHVWNYDFNGEAGIVESYISYLRRKIDTAPEGAPALAPLIQTRRGVGYMLRLPPESA